MAKDMARQAKATSKVAGKVNKLKILVPIEPSPDAGKLGTYSKKKSIIPVKDNVLGFFSQGLGMQPHIFSVSELASQVSEGMMAPNGVPLLLGNDFFQENEKNIKSTLDSKKKELSALKPPLDSSTELGFGHAVDAILKRTSKHDIGAVCLSTHGRKGLSRVLLGSVAEEVIRHCSKPVVVLGPVAQVPGKKIKSSSEKLVIGVATDLTKDSVHWEKKFLHWYFTEKSPRCEIALVHCFYSGLHPIEKTAVAFAGSTMKKGRSPSHQSRDERYQELARQVLSSSEAALEKRIHQWEEWIDQLPPSVRANIKGLSGHLNSDLVDSSEALVKMEKTICPKFWVTSTHSRGFISEAFLGSTVRHLILQSKLPVVVVPWK